MAAPAFRAVAGLVGANTNGATMTKPAGTVENDILIAVVQVFLGEGKFASAFSFGTGWTVTETKQIAPTANPSMFVVGIKRAGGSEPASYTLAWTGGAGFRAGYITAIKEGRTTGEPTDVAPAYKVTTVATNKPKSSSITTVTNNSLLVWVAGNDNGASYTPPTGYTERIDNETTQADAEKATAGATGEIEGTCAESRQQVVGLIAIPPLPTVFTETGEGTISVTGSSEESLTFTEEASGTVAVTGSAIEVLEFVEALSGTISVTGSFIETFETGTVTVRLPQYALSRHYRIYNPQTSSAEGKFAFKVITAAEVAPTPERPMHTKEIAVLSGAVTAVAGVLAAIGVIPPDIAIGAAGASALTSLGSFFRRNR